MQRGQNFIQGVFHNLSVFLKIFQFVILCHVVTLGLNVVTLIEFRKIKLLSRRDVGSQRCEVGYPYFGTSWNVATSVGTSFWHVVTLGPTSRHWI